MDYSEDLAIGKRPKMRCNWASKSSSYFLPVPKAGYGVRLLEHLSVDLSKKLGGGVSVRNLYRMRDFYLVHKILPPAAKLSWSQHVELLPLTNKTDKRRLEKRVIREKKGPYVLA